MSARFWSLYERVVPHLENLSRDQIIAIYVVGIAACVGLILGIVWAGIASTRRQRAWAAEHERHLKAIARAQHETERYVAAGRPRW